MTNHTRSSDDIERDIVHERAQMSDTIDDLQKKFSVDSIVSEVTDMFRGQGGNLGRSISQTVGRNPAAVALVGVGLAWLFLGQDRNQSANAVERPTGRGHDRHRNRAGATQRGKSASYQDWSNGVSDDDNQWYGNGQMPNDRQFQGWGTEHGGRNSANRGAASNGVMRTIRDGANAVSGAVSDAAGDLSDATTRLTERLSHGTEELSAEARDRVVSARRAAHDAREASEAAMKKAGNAATNFFDDQPLVVGALAVAVGAAIGSALPHSRIEDDTMGDSSDRLFDEAQTVFREERDKAMAVLRTAAADVKDEIGEVGTDLAELLPEDKSVGEVIVDHAAESAGRVFDGAKDEAAQQGVFRRHS